MIKLEKVTTNVMASVITIAGMTCVVTARAEHIPKTLTEIGLSPRMGSQNTLKDLDLIIFFKLIVAVSWRRVHTVVNLFLGTGPSQTL